MSAMVACAQQGTTWPQAVALCGLFFMGAVIILGALWCFVKLATS